MKKSFTAQLSYVVSLSVLFYLFYISTSSAIDKPFEGVRLNALMEEHPTQKVVAKLLPEFEAETGIAVNIEVLPFEMQTNKAKTTLNSRSAEYDVYMDAWINAVEWAVSGHIQPLTEYITDSDSKTKDNKSTNIDNTSINIDQNSSGLGRYIDISDFVEAYINDAKLGNTLYGLPMYGESTFLYYRKDLFEQYKIKVPETMEELMDAARQIKEQSKNQIYGITLRGREGIHSVYIWASFLWGFGGHWLNDQGQADLFTPEAVEAAQFYAALLNKYAPPAYNQFGWIENRDIFIRGKAAMSIDATVNGAFNEDPVKSRVAGKTGYALMPVKLGAKLKGGHTALVTHQMYINRYSKNRDAAFLFISWATSKKVQLKGLEIEPNCGVTSKTALHSPIYKEKFGAFTSSMTESLTHGNSNYLPIIKEGPFIFEKTGKALSEIISGKKPADKAMKELNQQINQYIDSPQ
ncbi:MAG: sugar ABC transporter substrate-binding protein, partial [Desulfamplus sp.]|nr:sugar ABC transporter substrate-binding protein [Desulfamplus sp.]MBF0412349.1 sugar ABC transporter substrate-binding protein [Desulfamplus sp.]